MNFRKKAKEMAEEEAARVQEEANHKNAINLKVTALMESLSDYLKELGPQVGREGERVTAQIGGDYKIAILVNGPEQFTVHDGAKLTTDCDEDEMMRIVVLWFRKALASTATARS